MSFIFSKEAPQALGPYSHAIVADKLVFCSGQTPVHPKTMIIGDPEIQGQTLQALKNLEAVLQSANCSKTDIIKVNVYLTDMKHFKEMNTVYETFFGSHKPARTTVAVVGLPHNALIEIECIARQNNSNWFVNHGLT